MDDIAKIQTVKEVLGNVKLAIPKYQRPYKWSVITTTTLLDDILFAITESENQGDKFKYRVGTIILHKETKDDKEIFNIVDGQQRLITLALIQQELGTDSPILQCKIETEISRQSLLANHTAIKEYFFDRSYEFKQKFVNAFQQILQFVVVTIENLPEAFQLFDSQNHRGKELDPHDLLKAYHLRAMHKQQSEMNSVVESWEAQGAKDIRGLFNNYLFPIASWVSKEKGHDFKIKDIGFYKGTAKNSPLSFARRIAKAMPIHQIDQPFVEGKDFFGFVEHYLKMLKEVQFMIAETENGGDIWLKGKGKGFENAKLLFECAVLFYYDRFGMSELNARVIKRLYAWAFMIRLNMQRLEFSTIRKYAIGDGERRDGETYIPMLHIIAKSTDSKDILNIQFKMMDCKDIRWESRRKEERITIEKVIGDILGGCKQ